MDFDRHKVTAEHFKQMLNVRLIPFCVGIVLACEHPVESGLLQLASDLPCQVR